MNRAAVQIDARARLDQVSRLVTARTAGRPRDDFIISRLPGNPVSGFDCLALESASQ